MISEYAQADKTTERHDQPGFELAEDLPPMTPETARRLAADLAPHLAAMRAVTVGTRYADSGGDVSNDMLAARPGAPVSPATKIFIAGMLQRISS